jgi:hypothetical protein
VIVGNLFHNFVQIEGDFPRGIRSQSLNPHLSS